MIIASFNVNWLALNNSVPPCTAQKQVACEALVWQLSFSILLKQP
jgi:hypothetical protein